MSMSLVGAAGSMAADRIRKRLGTQMVFAGASPVLVALLALMFVVRSFPVLGIAVVIHLVVGVSQPVLLSLVQDRVPDKARATLLSFGSMLNYAYLAAFEPVTGALADYHSIPTVFLACAALGCVFSPCRIRPVPFRDQRSALRGAARPTAHST